MSINIKDNLSLLTSLAPQSQKPDSNSVRQERGFADRLDRALSGGSSVATSSDKARALAESLSLQMLQTSLSLASDLPAETSAARPLSSVNSLLQAYSANLAETGENPVSASVSAPSQSPSQLQELSAAGEKIQPRAGIRSKSSDPSWLDPIIAKASRRYGVDVGLIKAVIKAESNFNPQAVSHAGARGLMQLMPATARSLGVSDSFDPEQNVMAGTRFLSELLQRYNGNVDSALAAYNWGPGNVDRRPDRLPGETRDYLVRVKQLYSSYIA
ncbi:MAG: lytic transglycosylase domain-containing protein [Desulfuromonadaceae bacterium]|nr:lytic transglycosylase domain-containing protein [Desulfuromonadaceae bacterium]